MDDPRLPVPIYAASTLDLGTRLRWLIDRIALIGVTGMIPAASFFADHGVSRQIRGAG